MSLWSSAHIKVLVFVAVSLSAPIVAAHAADTPRRILLLQGLTPTQMGSPETVAAFEQRLEERSSQPVEVFTDFLDSGRFQGQEAENRLVQFFSAKFAQKRPDLIVPISRSALVFMAKHRNEFARGIPVVYCCTPSSNVKALNLPPDLPGVVAEYDWKGTFQLAQRLQPTAKTVVIVSGSSAVNLGWQKDIIREIGPELKNYRTRYITSVHQEERLQVVSHLPRDSILILMPIFGEELSGDRATDIAANLAKAASVPAFSPVPTLLGAGIVGGNMDNYAAQGREAADLAFEILSGKAPETLPHETRLPLRIRVDARQLERWKLPEESLPHGSSVEFRRPTLWERHRIALVWGLLAFVLQAAVVVLWLLQKYKRHHTEKLLKESRDRLAAAAEAQRKEIEHIARVAVVGELSGGLAHELGQPLSAILLNAQAAQQLLDSQHHDNAAIKEILEEIIQQDTRASDVIHAMRRLLKKGQYQSSLISLNDLVTSTLELLRSELTKNNIRTEAELMPDLPLVRGDRVQLQQVLLNLLINGIEAMASIPPAERRLRITTQIAKDGQVSVAITNNGRALSAEELKLVLQPYFTTKEGGLGLGLPICATIAESHRGKLTISNVSGGVTAVLSLPVQVRAAAIG